MNTMITKRELACFLYDIRDLDGALLHNEAALHVLTQKSIHKGSNYNEHKDSICILFNNIRSIYKRMGNLDKSKYYSKKNLSSLSLDKVQLNAALSWKLLDNYT